MQLLEPDSVLPSGERCVVSVGNFDGVHCGHQLLIQEIVAKAESEGLKSALVTFEPHTRLVLNPDQPFELLTTFTEKAYLVGKSGIDYLLRIPFDAAFSRQSPEEFIASVLAEQLHAAIWVMGEDHRVGKDGEGEKNFLQSVLSKYHIMTFTADLLKQSQTVVSSTQIRVNITKGRIAEAVGMLGHPYLVSATRIEGLKVGSQLGYPTLNFCRPPSQKVLPPPGVYAAELEYEGQLQPGALYFGDCPTFAERTVHFEFHSFDNHGMFPEVGCDARLWLHRFIRNDQIFPEPEKLVAQIRKDIETIQLFFRGERSCH